jgi:glycosyltransferase involved in cell wall biosynthesis
MPVPSRSRKVLFVTFDDPDTPFIKQDRLFLEQWYVVEELPRAASKKRIRHLLSDPEVWRAVARNDAVFGWFGSCAPVVFMASVLRKPAVIVAGGVDVVKVPEIGYGLTHTWSRYWHTLGYRLAKRVLLFSNSSRQSFLELPGTQSQNSQTLYLGVDVDLFKPAGEKKDRALTVSVIFDANLRRKGLQTFVETAQWLPDVEFCVMGTITQASAAETIKSLASPNVSFLGYTDNNQFLERLLPEYQQAKIYAQLSRHEGFGMALAEAMACECIPVVTECGAMPEVVGDTGIYVPLEDPRATSEAIKQIIADPDNSRGKRARERISALYPLQKREQGLQATMEAVLR